MCPICEYIFFMCVKYITINHLIFVHNFESLPRRYLYRSMDLYLDQHRESYSINLSNSFVVPTHDQCYAGLVAFHLI